MDWVFQFNPRRHNLIETIGSGVTSDWWNMGQGRREVSPGDRVFFWQTGPNAKLVAIGEVTSPVYEKESEYGRFRVDVEYTYRIDPPLSRPEIRDNPVLAQFSAFKGMMGTNFPIREPAIAKELEKVLETRVVSLTSADAPAVAATQESPLAAAVRLADQANKKVRLQIAEQLHECISRMDPYDFEYLVGALLVKLG